MLSLTEIIGEARRSLKGQYGLVIGTGIAYGLIVIVLNFLDSAGTWAIARSLLDLSNIRINNGGLFQFLWTGAFGLGWATFILRVVRRNQPDFEQIFSGFRFWGKATWGQILVVLRVLLWMLLLIIPGLIKAIAYSQYLFVMVDYPELSANQAINRSEEIMYGHKWELFFFSFLMGLLALLGVLTLLIGFFWIGPWIAASQAKFYDEVHKDWLRRTGRWTEPTEPEEVTAA
jgi:uncharacterized membrane protein